MAQRERENIKIIGSAGKERERGINEDVSEAKAKATEGGEREKKREGSVKAREIGA